MDPGQTQPVSFEPTFQAILPVRLKNDHKDNQRQPLKTTFLTLPVEIQKEIFRYVLNVSRTRHFHREWNEESPETFVKTCRRLNDPTTLQIFLFPSMSGGGYADCFHEHTYCCLQPSLLRVCKQFNDEGRDVLWNENKFLSIHSSDTIGEKIESLVGECCAFYAGMQPVRYGCSVHRIGEYESNISFPHPVVSVVMRNKNLSEHVYLFPMIEYNRVIRGLFMYCAAHHHNMAALYPMYITLGFGPNLSVSELNCTPDTAMHLLFFDSALLWIGKWIRKVYFCDEEIAASTPGVLLNDPELSQALERLPYLQLTEHQDNQCSALTYKLQELMRSFEVDEGSSQVLDGFAEIVLQARAVWGTSLRTLPAEKMRKRIQSIMVAAAWHIPFIESAFDNPFDPVNLRITRVQIFYGLLAARAMQSTRYQHARVRLHLRLAMLFQKLNSECEYGYRQLHHAIWLFHYPSSADQTQMERAEAEISAAVDSVLARVHTITEIRKIWSGKRPLLEKLVVWSYRVGILDSPETKKARFTGFDAFPEFLRETPL